MLSRITPDALFLLTQMKVPHIPISVTPRKLLTAETASITFAGQNIARVDAESAMPNARDTILSFTSCWTCPTKRFLTMIRIQTLVPIWLRKAASALKDANTGALR